VNLSLLAHRGVHQTYHKKDLPRDACTATRIDEPTHLFIENTIGSIRKAFSLGSDIVEIDIHPTTDGKFAVFHDWTIDCRTEGAGVVRQQSLEYLQTLDVGYGYTHDGGLSFPLRGKSNEKIPSLTEVLDQFPTQKFLINIKSNSAGEADLISQFLDQRPHEELSRLWFYGGPLPTSRLLALRPELKGFTRKSVRQCAIRYEAIAWTGYIPESCRNTVIAIPYDYAPFFWGWPRLLVSRMEAVGSSVILVDMNYGHMAGIDDPNKVQALSENYRGIVWTDKIEEVGLINRSN